MCFTYQCQMVGGGVDLVGMSGKKTHLVPPNSITLPACVGWFVSFSYGLILMSILYMANGDFGNWFFFHNLYCVVSFRHVLYNDFRMWLQEITGFTDLTDQVDMSCAKYEHTGE